MRVTSTDKEDLMDQSTSTVAFAGLDWGGAHHQLCVVDDHGRRRSDLRVTHDVAGLGDLEAELARFATSMPVAVERAEGLVVERLQAAGHVVFPVSPRIAARGTALCENARDLRETSRAGPLCHAGDAAQRLGKSGFELGPRRRGPIHFKLVGRSRDKRAPLPLRNVTSRGARIGRYSRPS